MKVTIKYFGLLAEVTGCIEEQIDFSGKTILDLKSMLFEKYELLKTKDFQVAQNNCLTMNDAEVKASEIALLPPFAGG